MNQSATLLPWQTLTNMQGVYSGQALQKDWIASCDRNNNLVVNMVDVFSNSRGRDLSNIGIFAVNNNMISMDFCASFIELALLLFQLHNLPKAKEAVSEAKETLQNIISFYSVSSSVHEAIEYNTGTENPVKLKMGKAEYVLPMPYHLD